MSSRFGTNPHRFLFTRATVKRKGTQMVIMTKGEWRQQQLCMGYLVMPKFLESLRSPKKTMKKTQLRREVFDNENSWDGQRK